MHIHSESKKYNLIFAITLSN